MKDTISFSKPITDDYKPLHSSVIMHGKMSGHRRKGPCDASKVLELASANAKHEEEEDQCFPSVRFIWEQGRGRPKISPTAYAFTGQIKWIIIRNDASLVSEDLLLQEKAMHLFSA